MLADIRCRQLVLVGYSMVGLVIRSAVRRARKAGEPWLRQLTHIACIGSPHSGAPLEQAAHTVAKFLGRFNTSGTQVPAKVLRARSQGLRDLRRGQPFEEPRGLRACESVHGSVADELLEHTTHLFVASSLARRSNCLFDRMVGDGLVPVASACGPSGFNRASRIIHGVGHHQLPNHPKVLAVLWEWLSQAPVGQDFAAKAPD